MRDVWSGEGGDGNHVIELGNEFAEVLIRKIDTRNGSRLLISSPKSGHSISLCPLELEALTWQNQESLSKLINNPYGPMVLEGEDE